MSLLLLSVALLALAVLFVAGGWYIGTRIATHTAQRAERRFCRDLNDDLKGAAHV